MYYYKTIFQYRGNQYAGFQWQKNLTTVQGEINLALRKILKGKTTTMSASRTDSGVHALFQIVKITCEHPLQLGTFLNDINSHLPKDIHCLAIGVSDALFKPNSHSSNKEYRYFFTNKKLPNKEEQLLVANISNQLNIELIEQCLVKIIGTHDFCNFASSGSNVRSTIRTIMNCELSIINPQEFFLEQSLFFPPPSLTQCYQLRISADGFLKQMIRHLVSALWLVGSGKMSVEEFFNLIDGEKRKGPLWKVAPANGLYLYNINY